MLLWSFCHCWNRKVITRLLWENIARHFATLIYAGRRRNLMNVSPECTEVHSNCSNTIIHGLIVYLHCNGYTCSGGFLGRWWLNTFGCLLTWTVRSNSLRKTKSVILTNSAVRIFADRCDLNDSPDSGSFITSYTVCCCLGEDFLSLLGILHKITLIIQACKLKLNDPQGALTDCDYAMQTGVDNVKALFRQGQVISTLAFHILVVLMWISGSLSSTQFA